MLVVDTDQLLFHADAAAGLADELDTLRQHTQSAGPSPRYTTLPGLAELGAYHRDCLSGPEGSGVQAIAYLLRHVDFVVDALRCDATAIDSGDYENAAALEGLLVDETSVILPQLPQLGFAPLPAPGVVGNDPAGMPDVEALTNAVETTNLDEVHRSAWLWGELNRVAQAVGDRFSTISYDLSASTEGEGPEQASETLLMLAQIARAVALAAQVMQLCVEFIAVIVDILRSVLGLLAPGLRGLEAPARALVERSFLDALPGQLGVLLRFALPPVMSLISGQLRSGVDTLSWIIQRHSAPVPQLQWPADVERAMCLCSQCTCPLKDTAGDTVTAADAGTRAATVGATPAGVGTAGAAGLGAAMVPAGVGALATPVGAPLGTLGTGVTMAHARSATMPAGIGVGSPATLGRTAGPMMGPIAAGRGATPPRTKRSPDQGAGLRC